MTIGDGIRDIRAIKDLSEFMDHLYGSAPYELSLDALEEIEETIYKTIPIVNRYKRVRIQQHVGALEGELRNRGILPRKE